MTFAWRHAGAASQAAPDAVTVVEGTTFCISHASGDFDALRPAGLFVRDTRLLSTWTLDVDGLSPEPLTVHHSSPHTALMVSRVRADSTSGGVDLLVLRQRFVGEGMLETIRLRNATGNAARVRLTLHVGTDFADAFAVREGRDRALAPVEATVGDGTLQLSVHGSDQIAATVATDREAKIERDGFSWWVELDGQATWTTHLQVVPRMRGVDLQPHHVPDAPPEESAPAQRARQFRRSTPRLTTSSRQLADVLTRSLVDLGTLRIFDPERPRLPVVAAGAPWSMALFGRDSLLASMMLLPVDGHLALGTLTTLAAHQGSGTDPRTGEQPGRIPHELRFGPTGSPALDSEHASYRSSDATPLFVMATGALHRWHPHLVSQDLVDSTDLALEWMQGPGDPDGDGFLECTRSLEGGPSGGPVGGPVGGGADRGWRDSCDGVTRADGSVPEPPIALAETQAYAYAAYLGRAEIASAAGQHLVAEHWRSEAARLKRAFNDVFWMPELGWYADGLDRHKRHIGTVTSSVGHCLWTGIVDDDKAQLLVPRLMSPQMFTGWGTRTLGSDMAAYNPLGYHTGSVWPHDTALCVAGLSRYGFTSEAAALATGLLDAATSMGNRMPELFAGLSRSEVPVPVPHPAACSPQAWAAAAPVEVLRALLRLEPTTPDGLTCSPFLPEGFLPLELSGLRCRGLTYDLAVDVHGVELTPRI